MGFNVGSQPLDGYNIYEYGFRIVILLGDKSIQRTIAKAEWDPCSLGVGDCLNTTSTNHKSVIPKHVLQMVWSNVVHAMMFTCNNGVRILNDNFKFEI